MGFEWRIRDPRPIERVRAHYEVERALAARLRDSAPEERQRLYGEVYDELFRRVPDHPQLVNRASMEERGSKARAMVGFLRRLVPGAPVFMELGPGDCLISLEMAAHARQVFAIDVSEEITREVTPPGNFRLVLSDGCSIDVPPGSVDLAFSNQLMEHLHPEDALAQVRNIHRALAPGGRYFCITPNRLSGPHDVSSAFDDEATGFHLKEYTARELERIFLRAGFRKVKLFIGLDGHYLPVPRFVVSLVERLVGASPVRLRKAIAPTAPMRLLLGVRMLAIK